MNSKNNKTLSKLFFAVAFLAVALSALLFFMSTEVSIPSYSVHTSYEYYGGDAYTGIQQAAADTSRNVANLISTCRSGLESVVKAIYISVAFVLVALAGLFVTLGVKHKLVANEAKLEESKTTAESNTDSESDSPINTEI